MIFRVVIQPPARLDIDAAFIYLAQRSMRSAERWLHGLEDAMQLLGRFPRRFGLAPENRNFPKRFAN